MMRIKNTSAAITVALVVLLLQGCGLFSGEDSYFRNRSNDYLNADKIESVKVPEGMSAERMGQLYPMPQVVTKREFTGDPNDDYDVPRPEPLASNLIEERVKIQRLGQDRWILINVSPGEVWPRIRGFLGDNGLTIVHADITQGIIDSNWLQFKSDLTKYDRYRIQIDQGVQPETSEIHILHHSVVGKPSVEAQENWPALSTSNERESLLLDELAATLASDVTIGGTSLLAQSIGGEAKSSLVVQDNEPVMLIKLNRARARATLGYAIKQDGFSVFESDSDNGHYYLSYVVIDDEEGDGWFSGIFGGDKKEALLVAQSPHSLAQLLANMPTGEAFINAPITEDREESGSAVVPGYLLFMTGEPGDFVIRIRDPYGHRLTPRQARQLLTVIRTNLI